MNIQHFPTTRYYGSKRRLLSWIYDHTKNLEFNSIFDRFGGTSSVSLLFQSMGKKVYFHDALKSNTISAKTILNSNNINVEEINQFFSNITPHNGFISKNFKNIYYSNEENMWLDGAITKLQKQDNADALWYCLFQASLKKRPFNTFHRANYNLRTRNVQRNFGNLTTWNTPFTQHIYTSSMELEQFISAKNKPTQATILSSQNLGSKVIDADAIYLDPPYIQHTNNSDDYFKKYHFLESMTNYNNWRSCINHTTKTKAQDTPEHIKIWNNKNTFKDLLFEEITKYRDKIVILSYQTNGYPSYDNIYDFFISIFPNVTIKRKENFSHALAKTKKTELLIIGIPE